jgi:hypothetical protein
MEPLAPPDSVKVRHYLPGSGQFGGPYTAFQTVPFGKSSEVSARRMGLRDVASDFDEADAQAR